MKKTILATAVPALLAASSAYAGINLYDADGVKVDATGATEVQYRSKLDKGSDGQFRIDDADLQFDISSDIGDGLTAIGRMAFEFEGGAVTNDKLFVGIKGDFGTMTVGRQTLIADDAGIGKDYEFGGESIDFVKADGDQVVKYTFEAGDVYGGVSALVESDGKDSTGGESRVYDGKIGYTGVSGLDVRGFLYQGRDIKSVEILNNNIKATKDIDGFELEAEYAMDAVSLAASYGHVKYEDSTKVAGSKDLAVDAISLSADYTQGKNILAGGVNYYIGDLDGAKQDYEQYTVYANITHKFNSNVKAYFELGVADGENEKGEDLKFETAYAAGLEVKF